LQDWGTDPGTLYFLAISLSAPRTVMGQFGQREPPSFSRRLASARVAVYRTVSLPCQDAKRSDYGQLEFDPAWAGLCGNAQFVKIVNRLQPNSAWH
jgi:hypothetical protein